MNRITQLFEQKKNNVLNIYFTAGYPQLNDTTTILKALDESGADLVEIGMPYSDPVADGETIQHANQVALDNGMSVKLLFEQLAGIRPAIKVPILLMGYINPVLQFGIEEFCKKCQEVGVDGLILPDLPADVYEEDYKAIFEKYGILNIFLITPQTSESRISHIDAISEGFIYMVSSASITGAKSGISDEQEAYFSRINAMNLKNPRLIGFGISDNATFTKASSHAAGAIIGSAFIKVVTEAKDLSADISAFVKSVKGE
ncbi:tryptophan synthase subunit alpha [Flectobacillus rivi]|jgi:tryptophan synthase alpha chain|uniref:Tryptophan synthase alpha chain n=1 Tax=Flectobacillus rivi TaxID=2984209 RepID=A0ABT6Z6T6_9BACT|nr:tryptophan synthase subunit alpha [Flectobacillus rivi]MDI9876841.1 tryptophan synthase subunit alpha [Flectobacillus rivi]